MATQTATVVLSAKNAMGSATAAAAKDLGKVEKAAKDAGKAGSTMGSDIAKGLGGVAAGFVTMEAAKKVFEVGVRALGASIAEALKTDTAEKFKKVLGNVTESWKDLQAGVGQIIAQNPAVVAGMDAVDEVLARVLGSLQGNTKGAQEFVRKGLLGLLTGIEWSIRAGGFLVQTFDGLKVVWRGLQLLIVDGALKIVEGLDTLGRGAVAVLNLFRDEGNKLAAPFSGAVEAMRNLRDAARETLDEGLDDFQRHRIAADRVADAIHGIKTAVGNATIEEIKLAKAVGETTAAQKAAAPVAKDIADTQDDVAKKTKDATKAIEEQEAAATEAGQTWQQYAANLFDVGNLVGRVFGDIINIIREAVSFNREAAQMMVADMELGLREQRLNSQQAYDELAAARQALHEAEAKGDRDAVDAAQMQLERARINYQRNQRAIRQMTRETNEARVDAEKTTGQRILEAAGKWLGQLVLDIIAAAATKIIVDLVSAQVSAISAHAGIPYVGLAIGLGAAAAIAAAIAGIAASMPKAQAADRGIIDDPRLAKLLSGSPGGETQLVAKRPGESVLSERQTDQLVNRVGGGSIVLNITIAQVENARELVRRIAPEIRRAQMQGAF